MGRDGHRKPAGRHNDDLYAWSLSTIVRRPTTDPRERPRQKSSSTARAVAATVSSSAGKSRPRAGVTPRTRESRRESSGRTRRVRRCRQLYATPVR